MGLSPEVWCLEHDDGPRLQLLLAPLSLSRERALSLEARVVTRILLGRLPVPRCGSVQGYLAYKKPHHPRTLQ